MNKNQLIKELISHYEYVVAMIEGLGYKEAFSICVRNEVDKGICWCVERRFGHQVYFSDATDFLFNNGPGFIFPPPFKHQDIKESLIYRINFLKNEYIPQSTEEIS